MIMFSLGASLSLGAYCFTNTFFSFIPLYYKQKQHCLRQVLLYMLLIRNAVFNEPVICNHSPPIPRDRMGDKQGNDFSIVPTVQGKCQCCDFLQGAG